MKFTLYYLTNVISYRIKLCFMELRLIKTKGEKIIDKIYKNKNKTFIHNFDGSSIYYKHVISTNVFHPYIG